MGKRPDDKRSFLSLVSNGTHDAKIEVPATAMLDGAGG